MVRCSTVLQNARKAQLLSLATRVTLRSSFELLASNVAIVAFASTIIAFPSVEENNLHNYTPVYSIHDSKALSS